MDTNFSTSSVGWPYGHGPGAGVGNEIQINPSKNGPSNGESRMKRRDVLFRFSLRIASSLLPQPSSDLVFQCWFEEASYGFIFPTERFDSPSGGVNHGFVSAPDRRLGAIVGSLLVLLGSIRLLFRAFPCCLVIQKTTAQ